MKTGQIYIVAWIILLATSLYGCYYDKVITFDGLPENVSFKNDVLPILTQNCTSTGCHDAVPAHAPSLVSDKAYSALIEGNYLNIVDPPKSRLYMELSSGSMPPSGALEVNEQLIILGWITEGAPNN